MDEKPGSHNGKLPGVEYALESVEDSAGGLNCRPTSSAVANCAHPSPLRGSEGEWLLPGVSTYGANVLTGCSAPEGRIKRCAADHLASASSKATDASW